jgi:TRAP-type mannitol/chloroaromatic compound transport system permease small subunit
VWPLVLKAFLTGEMSSSASGLIRWPVYALVPAGFCLLGLQGLSELFKRIAFLAGHGPDPAARKPKKTAEEELAEVLRERAEAAAAAASQGPAR